jgi:hypothetical protein
MELNVKIEGEDQDDVAAKLMAYLLEVMRNKGTDMANAQVNGVTAQWGGDGP